MPEEILSDQKHAYAGEQRTGDGEDGFLVHQF
jgi:hypothetical protein